MYRQQQQQQRQQQQQQQLKQQHAESAAPIDSLSDVDSAASPVSTSSRSAASITSNAWDLLRMPRPSNSWTPLSAPTPLGVLPTSNRRLSLSGASPTSPLRFSHDLSRPPAQDIPRSPQNITRFDIKAASITGVSPLAPKAKNLAQSNHPLPQQPRPVALPRANTHHAGTSDRVGGSQSSQFRLFKPRVKFSATSTATTVALETGHVASIANSKLAMPRVPSSDTSLDVRLRSAKESGAYTRDVSAASEFLARVRFAMLNLRKRFNPKKRALSKAEIPSSATPTAVPGGMPFVHRASTTTSTATTRSTTRWSETSATGLHGYTAASSLAESSSREGTIVGSSARSSLGPSSFNPAPIHVRGTLESFERRWREAGGKQDISRGGDLMDFSVNGSRFQGLD